jgi:hypothetical protein
MIAISPLRRRRSLALAAAACLVAAAVRLTPDTELLVDPPPPPRTPAWAFIPLDGTVRDDSAPGPGACLPLVDELVQRPGWTLHVIDRGNGCTGGWENSRFQIHASGEVRWAPARAPVRTLWLTPDELARVRALNRHDCAFRWSPREHDGYVAMYFELGWSEGKGVSVRQGSEIGDELGSILDGAIERYAVARLAALGGLRLELDIAREADRRYRPDEAHRSPAPEQLTVAYDGRLTITRRGHVVVDDRLDARQLADLADTLLAGGGSTAPPDEDGRGHAVIGARVIPFHLDLVDHAAFRPLSRAIVFGEVSLR